MLPGLRRTPIKDDEFICFTADSTIIPSRREYYQILFAEKVKWRDQDGVPGSTQGNIKIGVVFLDGNDTQKEEVRKYARTWITESQAGIEWVFDPYDPTNPAVNQIRITFKGKNGPWPRGNWSAVGREARDIPKTEPTMSFATDTDKAPSQRAILHEFGRALGLEHEHQHPWRTVDLRRDEIVKDHMGTAWCTKAGQEPNKTVPMTKQECEKKVDEQIINTKLIAELCHGSEAYDPKSIMHYPILDRWTRQNKSIGPNIELSRDDKKCISDTYPTKVVGPPVPPPGSAPPEAYCYVNIRFESFEFLRIRTMPKLSQETAVDDHFNLRDNTLIHVTRLTNADPPANPPADGWRHADQICLENSWDNLVRPGYVLYRYLRCAQTAPPRCGPIRPR